VGPVFGPDPLFQALKDETMSNDTTKQAEQSQDLPSADQAYSYLFDQVHARAFFGKLAEYNIEPATQKEAQDLLEMAGKLRVVAQDDQVKQASAGNSRFASATAALNSALQDPGAGDHIKAAAEQERTIARGRIVDQLAKDPSIYNSVLGWKAAEAEQIASHLGMNQQPEDAAA
jgi:hypothetical protein